MARRSGGRAIGRHGRDPRRAPRGNSRSDARSKPRVPGRGGRERVGTKPRGWGPLARKWWGRRIGEDQGFGSRERGEEDEDEDADEDADQENEEEEVTEQKEENTTRRSGRERLMARGGVPWGAPVARGVGVAAPLAVSAPPEWSRGAGARLTPLLASRGSYEFCDTQ